MASSMFPAGPATGRAPAAEGRADSMAVIRDWMSTLLPALAWALAALPAVRSAVFLGPLERAATLPLAALPRLRIKGRSMAVLCSFHWSAVLAVAAKAPAPSGAGVAAAEQS